MAHPGIPPIHDTRKVFGIGWAKTGTTTLGVCLKRLGFRHQGQDLSLVHDLQRGDLSRILDIATRHQVFEDWPWLLLFRELDAFPREPVHPDDARPGALAAELPQHAPRAGSGE